ncbi:hypothetical protein ES703_66421 [subsurface metagenome]
MRLARIGLAIVISLVLMGLVCPVVQADDNKAEVDLKVEVVPPPRRGGGVGGGGRGFVITIIMDGKASYYAIGREGKIRRAITATSEDANLTVTSLAHTIALDEDGDRLGIVEVKIDDTPACPPPENAYIIGLPRSFKPGGATFDPPITLEYTYDPADIPEGVAEEDLILAYCDEETEEWVVLEDFEVDTVNNIITARVSHFSTLAILGFVTPPIPPPPAPGPEPAPPPVPEPEPTPPPIPEPEPAPPPVPTPPSKVNWAILGPILGVAVFLAIFLPIRWYRRSRRW